MWFIPEMFITWHFAMIGIWFVITAFCVGAEIWSAPLGLALLVYLINRFAFDYVIDFDIASSVKFIVVYMVIGLFWSMFKWYRYLVKQRDLRTQMELKPDRIDISDHAEKVITWNMYWPFSALGFLFFDAINKLYRTIFEIFKGCYQKISDHVYRNLND